MLVSLIWLANDLACSSFRAFVFATYSSTFATATLRQDSKTRISIIMLNQKLCVGHCSRCSAPCWLPARVLCFRHSHISRQRCLTVSAGSKQKACTVSVDPLEPMQLPCNGPTCRIPVTIIAVGAILAAYWFKRQAQEPSKKLPEPWPEIPNPTADPVAYQKALARTRQAQDVQKAVGFMHAGEPARAMVELHRALEENSVCRSPLLDGHQTRQELEGLYQLHIENTEVPPHFATLLQLREMFGLDRDTAERIEEDVLKQSQAFSI